MKNFWKKVGIGAAIGLAFGIVGASTFFGFKKMLNTFFPDKERTTISEEALNGDGDEAQTSDNDKDGKKDLKEAYEGRVSLAEGGKNTDSESRTKGSLDVSELAENNLPCVVSITNTSVSQVRDMWGRGVREYENVSCGSGIIIGETDEELLIATNCHVVSGASSITAGFIDDEIYEASLKGADADIDLAVIGVNKSSMKDSTLDTIKIAVIGDSDSLKVGEQVVAIGNAIGYGQSVTTGIISALNRDIPDDDSDVAYIQTDAAINPGNSGGALLNMDGELIGINSAKIASTYVEGIGYAIPMESARPIIESLMNRKTREKVDEKKAGYLGISGVSVDASTSQMYGIPEGIYLQTVEEDGPAAAAGLKKGDVIRKFDGITVSSITDLRNNLDYYEEGETVDFVIYRADDGEYKEQTIAVKLGAREGTALDPDNASEGEASSKEGSESDGGITDNGEAYGSGSESGDYQDFYNNIPDELKDFFNGFGQR